MAKDKKQAILIFDRVRALMRMMPPEEFKETMVAMFDYFETGEEPGDGLTLPGQMVFTLAKEDIDENNRRYQAKCEQNRKNVNSRYGKIEKIDENGSEQLISGQTTYDRIRPYTNEYERTLKEKEKEKEKALCFSSVGMVSSDSLQSQEAPQTPTQTTEEKQTHIPGWDEIEKAAEWAKARWNNDAATLKCIEFNIKTGWKTIATGEHRDIYEVVTNWMNKEYPLKRKKQTADKPERESSFNQEEFLDLAMKRSFKDQTAGV